MTADSRHRRPGIVRRRTGPALNPVPHDPPPTAYLPRLVARPVGAMIPASIVPPARGLNGVHATEVLPALRAADTAATQVIPRVHPGLAERDRHYAAMRESGDRLLEELRVRYDVIIAAFDEQHAAEAAAWDAVAAMAGTEDDLSPYEGMDAQCTDIDQKIDGWVNDGHGGLKRYNRNRVNNYWQQVVGPVREAYASLGVQTQAAVSSARLLLAQRDALGARDVGAPTDTFPALTPRVLSAMDAVRYAEAAVLAVGAECGEPR